VWNLFINLKSQELKELHITAYGIGIIFESGTVFNKISVFYIDIEAVFFSLLRSYLLSSKVVTINRFYNVESTRP
jgi:hypothetical protein